MNHLLAIILLSTASQTLRAESPALNAVHEWGTFTTFSGSDGAPLAWWTPSLEGPAALPEFVQSIGMKIGAAHSMRMETPVLYFYASQPAEVSVRVDYRQGLLTDIFPPGKQEIPQPSNPLQPSSAYTWKVDLLPPDSDARNDVPSVGARGAHYAHAREVPSAWIVRSRPRPGDDPESKANTEKFIFYRGAGVGTLPLRTWLGEDGSLSVGASSEITTEAFVVRVQNGVVHWRAAPISTKPERDSRIQRFRIAAPEKDGSAETLAVALRQALSAAGLTSAEAAAMVATWHEAWLTEEGTRLLYLLPETWINEQLPLKISPEPKELKRVFVARSELFPLEQEQLMMKALTGPHTDAERARMISDLRLGRFTNAALERAVKISENKLRAVFSGAMAYSNPSTR
ncbi:MAG: hypothetical protein V4662_18335 [Verrucomicrobiota bacterium]